MIRASACTGGRTPVTLEQAVKAPIFSAGGSGTARELLQGGEVHLPALIQAAGTSTITTVSSQEVWLE